MECARRPGAVAARGICRVPAGLGAAFQPARDHHGLCLGTGEPGVSRRDGCHRGRSPVAVKRCGRRRAGTRVSGKAQPTGNCYRIGTGPESIQNITIAWEVALRVGRTLLALIGLSLLLSMILTPAFPLAQDATRVQTAAGCTAGSSGIGDPYYPLLGNSGYDVQHYTLDLDLDVAGASITAGNATIDAIALVDLCAFNLDFLGLEIDAITVDGQPAAFTRHSGELTVDPATPLASGSRFTTEIAYHGAPIGQDAPTVGGMISTIFGAIFGRGGGEQKPDPEEGEQYGSGLWRGREEIFIAGEPAGAESWFPVNGHPADKATYTLRLTVPEPYSVVANGIFTETIATEIGTTTVWESRNPMASYLVTLHAGRLTTDVREGPRGLPIRTAFAASVSQAQRGMFDRMPEMIDYFEGVFGPYAFESA